MRGVRRVSPGIQKSWQEVLDRIAAAIEQTQALYGRDAVGVFGGGSLTNEKAYSLGKFARVALRTLAGSRYSCAPNGICDSSSGVQ